jgi:hypothetical protein
MNNQLVTIIQQMIFMSNRVPRIVTIHCPIKNVSIVRSTIIEADIGFSSQKEENIYFKIGDPCLSIILGFYYYYGALTNRTRIK